MLRVLSDLPPLFRLFFYGHIYIRLDHTTAPYGAISLEQSEAHGKWRAKEHSDCYNEVGLAKQK